MSLTTAKRVIRQPALPYPIGITINVFRDDGRWGEYRAWFMRSDRDLRALAVAKITLAHFDDEDEPAFSHDEWCDESERLVAEYPDCLFIY